ncbi:TetR/AcrR family transcriptional regulator [Vagococcus coleopterorum]|uniref:TetR/AcrR family transcriptional regulator n=1 Tax=Vagococcus coleopterorum TaxID=2714946 RepID=A0A6G8APA2_9ENTE|nr:TetR/AcrR family transcriptional regulator [Vagococcus coleopterorum]QIL46772.1 TetR/AcrR family transcriptional regulator [Vagococcus coleopterorum]
MVKKYTAEEAKTLILDVSTQLFIENGYEKTSISDIVKGLDGLTKGAVYHHFSSKDEIIDAVVRRFIPNQDALVGVMAQTDLTGLEKIQALLFEGMFNSEASQSRVLSFTLLDNPKFFSMYIQTTNEVMAPLVEACLSEGNLDGSVSVEHPKQMAELAILILSTWFIQALFPNTAETFFEKIMAAKTVLEHAGMPIISDEVLTKIDQEIMKKVAELNDKD